MAVAWGLWPAAASTAELCQADAVLRAAANGDVVAAEGYSWAALPVTDPSGAAPSIDPATDSLNEAGLLIRDAELAGRVIARLPDADAALFEKSLAWATYLGVATLACPPVAPRTTAQHAQRLTAALRAAPGATMLQEIAVRGDRDAVAATWLAWHHLRQTCDAPRDLHVVLHIHDDGHSTTTSSTLPSTSTSSSTSPSTPPHLSPSTPLPSGPWDRWLAEPLAAVVISVPSIRANAQGRPCVAEPLRHFLQRVIALGHVRLAFSHWHEVPTSAPWTLADLRGFADDLEDSCPLPAIIDVFAEGYHDVLQRPLQPLMDDLSALTYAGFERDTIKYAAYQDAMYQYFVDRRAAHAGAHGTADGAIMPALRVLIAGAGRGPLVDRCLVAAEAAEVPLDLMALEKSPVAFLILQRRQREVWQDRVRLGHGDMRHWRPADPAWRADLLVSELLGSLGDNELSPECIEGARPLLADGGAIVPAAYTAFIAPIMSDALWQAARHAPAPESPYVVHMRRAQQPWPAQPLWTFTHRGGGGGGSATDTAMGDGSGSGSGSGSEGSRVPRGTAEAGYACDRQVVFGGAPSNGASGPPWLIHGFAGYFSATLYGDVTLSIEPATTTPGLCSWFAMWLPLATPLLVRPGEAVAAHVWRCAAAARVWYEWTADVRCRGHDRGASEDVGDDGDDTPRTCHRLMNAGGHAYWIGL